MNFADSLIQAIMRGERLDGPRLDKLQEWVLAHQSPYYASRLVWAYARCGARVPSVAVQLVERFAHEMSGQSLAGIYFAAARGMMQLSWRVEARAIDAARDLGCRPITSIIWSYGMLQRRIPLELLDELPALAGWMDEQGVSQVLWACARTGQEPHPAVFERAVLPAIAGRMNRNQLANVAWAFACFGRGMPDDAWERVDSARACMTRSQLAAIEWSRKRAPPCGSRPLARSCRIRV